jgi:hypothetical protein
MVHLGHCVPGQVCLPRTIPDHPRLSQTIPHVTLMSQGVWGPFLNAWKWFTYHYCFKLLAAISYQFSKGPGHIQRWPGTLLSNIHNGPGQDHTSVAMVQDMFAHSKMARDIALQHSQWSGQDHTGVAIVWDIYAHSKMAWDIAL